MNSKCEYFIRINNAYVAYRQGFLKKEKFVTEKCLYFLFTVF